MSDVPGFEDSEAAQVLEDIFKGNSPETHYVLAVAALKDIQEQRGGRGIKGYDSTGELADCVWAMTQAFCGMLRLELDHSAEMRKRELAESQKSGYGAADNRVRIEEEDDDRP